MPISIAPRIGATLYGVTLVADPRDATLAALRAALARHLVVAVPEQSLTPAELRGLEAVHSYDGPGRPEHATESAVHPVARRHP